ncbi:MAG TPA: aldehyde dehydrogenase family protein, partial [Melioribacteraceae bacterium]|nr:aldehyde dehydrogenase family protein [Melioribacteraceae bacterium]
MKLKPFKNNPITDFSKPANFKKQEEALAIVEKQFGKTYPLQVGNKALKTEAVITSINPSNKDQVIAYFNKATKEIADKAVVEAAKTFETWKNVNPEERAKILLKASEIIQKRRFEINAWMIFEAGKNFTEADADTAEAIDFLEFYAREILRYSAKQPITPVPGEANELFYVPMGVYAVIPPWNFPFAILVGMTSAAIVCGNTVVLKPSSDTPMMGRLFYDILIEAGLPKGVLNFVPGSGAEVGD